MEAPLRGDCSSSNALRGEHHKGSGIAGANRPEKAQVRKLSEQKSKKEEAKPLRAPAFESLLHAGALLAIQSGQHPPLLGSP